MKQELELQFFIAVSKSENPGGAYWIYFIDVNIADNPNFLWDFPQVGRAGEIQVSLLRWAKRFKAIPDGVPKYPESGCPDIAVSTGLKTNENLSSGSYRVSFDLPVGAGFSKDPDRRSNVMSSPRIRICDF